VSKANAVVGGSILGCKIATLPDGKLHHEGKSLTCVKKNKKLKKLKKFEIFYEFFFKNKIKIKQCSFVTL